MHRTPNSLFVQHVIVFITLLSALLLLTACGGGSSGSGGNNGGALPGAPTDIKFNDIAENSTSTLVTVRGGWQIADNTIFYSTDGGSTWNPANGCPGGMNTVTYQYVINAWLAGGALYDTGTQVHTPQLCTSTDGITWTVLKTYPAYPDTTIHVVGADIMGIAIATGPNVGDCFLVINDYTGFNGLPQNWDNPTDCTGLPVPVMDQRIIASTFYVVGGPTPSGAYSWDGATWNAGPDTPALRTMQFISTDGASYFYAVGGGNGLIRISNDYVTWTEPTTPTTANINYIESNFSSSAIAVGDGGLLLSSTDASTWTLQSSGTSANLHAAVWDNTNARFVIVGENNTTVFFTP